MDIFVAENNSLRLGINGTITGEIYVANNGHYFPEKGWNDFPVIILGWWVNSFLGYIKSDLSAFEFCFMDGPYKLVYFESLEGTLELHSCRQYTDADEKHYLCHVSKAEVQTMLLKACRKLLREAARSDIPDDKLSGLKKLFGELKKLRL